MQEIVMQNKFWILRDKTGQLFLSEEEPIMWYNEPMFHETVKLHKITNDLDVAIFGEKLKINEPKEIIINTTEPPKQNSDYIDLGNRIISKVGIRAVKCIYNYTHSKSEIEIIYGNSVVNLYYSDPDLRDDHYRKIADALLNE